MSAIFYHDDQQKEAALASKQQAEAKLGVTLHTQILPLQEFTLAEDYHQKYRLQQSKIMKSEFQRMYPNFEDLIASTAAARVNARTAGHKIDEPLESLGLSPEGQEWLSRSATA